MIRKPDNVVQGQHILALYFVYLADILNFAMEIFVKCLTGKTITLEVEQSDTIENIKSKIKDRNGIRIDCQHLIFNEEEIDDARSIFDFINHGESRTFYLVIRLKTLCKNAEVKKADRSSLAITFTTARA
jgi:ubiquitin